MPEFTATSRDAVPATTTDQGEALLRRWCSAIGRGADLDALLAYFEYKQVRSIARFTARWSEDDLRANLDVAVALQEQTARRRGDLIRLRETRRFDWRTSTSQPHAGAVG